MEKDCSCHQCHKQRNRGTYSSLRCSVHKMLTFMGKIALHRFKKKTSVNCSCLAPWQILVHTLIKQQKVPYVAKWCIAHISKNTEIFNDTVTINSTFATPSMFHTITQDLGPYSQTILKNVFSFVLHIFFQYLETFESYNLK